MSICKKGRDQGDSRASSQNRRSLLATRTGGKGEEHRAGKREELHGRRGQSMSHRRRKAPPKEGNIKRREKARHLPHGFAQLQRQSEKEREG